MSLCGKFDGSDLFCLRTKGHEPPHFVNRNGVLTSVEELIELGEDDVEKGYYVTSDEGKQFVKGDHVGIRDGHLYVYEAGAIVFMVGVVKVKALQFVE